MTYNDWELIEIIKTKLNENRFYHSLCVAQSAKHLAEIYGGDAAKAYTCGILHDIMKNTPDDEQILFLKENGIELSGVEKINPKLYHAISGAVYIRNVLKIDDCEIYNAVRYHTTARAGMSLLEKIVYIADYISADRNYNGVDMMRKTAEESLEKAMFTGLEFTIGEIMGRAQTIHPDSVSCYNELILGGIKHDAQ